MNAWRFILASLRHYRRIHLAVVLGVAVATAVLTGALLVGDSMRGSLRDLTLQRLGKIDSVLVAGHMFRAELANDLANDPDFKKNGFIAAEPAVLMGGTLQAGSGNNARRATGISVIGCLQEFWSLGQGGPEKPLAADEVALTEPAARELGVKAGDNVLLRIPIATAIPADSTLGEKSDTSLSRTLKIAAVLPTEGLARFGIAPSQQLPRNVFVPLATMQDLLKQPGKANAVLVAATQTDQPIGEDSDRALARSLRPALDDYGLRLEQLTSPNHCYQISADQLVLPDEAVRAAKKVFPDGGQSIVTYLANTIAVGEGKAKRKIPYSTIAGVDSKLQIGPLLDEKGQPITLADDEIAINRWAADDLGAKIGDPIAVAFYDPESTHGKLHEHEPVPTFKLRSIVELKTANGQPTLAADPKLTPELPGVTDQKSISDWKLPFELTETIRPKDEEYWNQYRTTPKAFVSLATAKRLWPSRWGTISLMRAPTTGGEAASAGENLGQRLASAITPSSLGMTFLPVKQQGLAASAGTTPFEALFLGFSFFLIAAAIMLVALLFQLGIEQRASELGTLAAVGVSRRRITRLLAREGLLVSAIGATIGIVAGVLYAWLMVFGLRTWWLAAISTPFLKLHVSWVSLLIGWTVGIVVSWLTIRWSIRRLARLTASRLLSGSITDANVYTTRGSENKKRWRFVTWQVFRVVLVALTIVQCIVGFFLQGEAQAGIFFGSGAAMLMLLLGEIRFRLRNFGRQQNTQRSFSLLQLSALNTARNPGRSTLTIGLVAAASFLIVAVSAFHLNTGEGGTGGFDLVATSDLPIHYDLNTPDGRRELGFTDAASQQMDDWHVYSLRVAAGENASCLNLYQPKQPRVLGVPDSLIKRGAFNFAASANLMKDGLPTNKWDLLRIGELGSLLDKEGQYAIPVILDAATAIYSLHLSGVGAQFTIRDAAERPVTLQVVGLLENSVLQGNLLVSEANFLKMFPDTAGYRYFLIEQGSKHAPHADTEDDRGHADTAATDSGRTMSATLESTLAEEGFDAQDARDQLAQFLAVQNTYLSTFQSLGALGLLLGTIGVAVVQLRSVLERRGELALMRAEGFGRARLTRMVVWESAELLLGGLVVGCASAAVALIPQWAPHAASVPWSALGLLLGTIAVIGILAGWLATRSALRAPIVAALRGD